MCTAIYDNIGRALLGRTLDYECSFGEMVVVTPRQFELTFKHKDTIKEHLAIIGMAHISNNTPLYYDAMNEAGVCIVALNFPKYASYITKPQRGDLLTSYEVIPYLLSQATSARRARELIEGASITSESFSAELTPTPLHWMVSDKEDCFVIEQTQFGLFVYENRVGVLTNSPDFPFQMTNLSQYASLSSKTKENTLCKDVTLEGFSRGMGAFGLPGDFSSTSRFVRAVFARHSSLPFENDISRFFHIMDTVSVPYGAVICENGKPAYTIYTSLMDTEGLVYYFHTHKNRSIRAVKLKNVNLDGTIPSAYSVAQEEHIFFNN